MGPGEDNGARDRRRGRASITQLVLLGVVASAIGIAIALIIDWFPTAASTQAGPVDTLWDVLLIASVPVFVLVTSVILYSVVTFRVRPGQELEDGPPIHGNTRLEVIWTVIPAVLILGLCTYAYLVLHDVEEAKANEQKVTVIGQQFAWTFQYAGQDGKRVTSNDLFLAQGQPVKFEVKARDVLHDFWVPEFRMKIDAVPGITTSYRVTPKRLGTYDVVCAELCGIGHAYMRSRVHVLSRADYEQKLQQLAQPAAPSAGGGAAGTAAAGKQVFASNGCSSCHTLADAGATGTIGPNLAMIKGQTPAEIRQDIVDPNAKITKGYGPNIMPPTFGQTLSKTDLDALVAYLEEASKK